MKNSVFYVHRYCRQREVSGSCFFYSVHWPDGENVRFFVDAGAFSGEKNNSYLNGYFPFKAEKLSFGIITHLHFDHVGVLPVIVRQGFNGRIYSSYSTLKLLDVVLADTTTIVDKKLGTTIATIEEKEKTLDHTVGCAYNKIIKPHKNIKIIFLNNGHLVGAAIVLIIISCPGEQDITILHTGDYKDKNIFFDVEQPPENITKMNISSFVMESSYGNVDSTDSKFDECLEENISWAINKGFTVVCPTFALGRHQEGLYKIKNIKDKSKIPEDIPVIVDGKSSQIFNARFKYSDLDIKPEMKNFMPKNTYAIPRSANRNIVRKEIIKNTEPKIILSPGGMGDYGAAKVYLENLIQRRDVMVHGLGYASPISVLYKLLNTQLYDKVNCYGNVYTLNCIVKSTSELTSHAPRDILLRFMKTFPNIKSVSINHGELGTQKSCRKYVLNNTELGEENVDICSPEVGVIIKPEGIVGTFKTQLISNDL